METLNDIPRPSAEPVAGTHQARIMLVDDDAMVRDSLAELLGLEGYEVVACPDVDSARLLLAAERIEIVISDVNMPGGGGLALLDHVRRHHPEIVVVLVTGYGSIEAAVDAMRQGAFDYLTKPVVDDDVLWCVQRAARQQHLLAENRRLRRRLNQRYSFEGVIGGDHRMLKIFELVQTVAAGRTTVLITGESGTGKSLIARAIHAQSPRREGPFVEVSCASLPEALLESELFGHVAGAFTGAAADRQGKFAAADGGTIFLDEIGTATPAMQVKLLRVLQEHCFEPVGGDETRQVDVRVVLATNADLKEAVAVGEFREDLYYRVNVVNIELPPLRSRPGDIPLLAGHFLAKYADENAREIAGFDDSALRAMQSYDWPGNVRELENCMERAVLLCGGERITAADLPRELAALATHAPAAPPEAPSQPGLTLAEALAGPEKRILEAALQRHGGNRQAASAELDINRTTLYKKMKKYGIE